MKKLRMNGQNSGTRSVNVKVGGPGGIHTASGEICRFEKSDQSYVQ